MERPPFVIDAVTLGKTQRLDTYDALQDENLQNFFTKQRLKILHKQGLVTRRGAIKEKPRSYLKVFEKTRTSSIRVKSNLFAVYYPFEIKKSASKPKKKKDS